MTEGTDSSAKESRIAGIATAVVLGVCLGGFLNATRAQEYQPVGPPQAERPAPANEAAQPARRYAELELQPWRSGDLESGWRVDARASTVAAEEVSPEARSSGPLTAQAVAERAQLRAYDGAPPSIPHPVRQRSAAECLSCHAEGLAIGAAQARRLSHPAYASCTQCHTVFSSPVPSAEPSPAARARNDFRGLASPAHGERAWAGAPPVIPHATWMRQNCSSCHGAAARAGLRTSHPERRSCTQCHAPSAARDQRRAALGPFGASP